MRKELSKNQIKSAVIEIRFTPSVEEDFLAGMVNSLLNEDVLSFKHYPVMELPREIRKKDPNLQNSPWYEFECKNVNFTIGPYVISIQSPIPYSGWDSWFEKSCDLLKRISPVIKAINSVRIRYVNVFEIVNILPYMNISLEVNNQKVETSPVSLRYEKTDSDRLLSVQIINNGIVSVGNEKPRKQSICDISCDYFFDSPMSMKDFNLAVIADMHTLIEDEFFNLSKQTLIERLM